MVRYNVLEVTNDANDVIENIHIYTGSVILVEE